MIQLPLVHFNCKYLEGDKPCFANKQYSVFCGDCSYYEKTAGEEASFPEIPEGKTISGSNDYINILIIKLDAVGDVLRTTSILPSIKKILPGAKITWITKTKSLPVLKDNTYINSIYPAEGNLEQVFSESFDIAINLDSGKDSCRIMEKISAAENYGYTLTGGKPYPLNKFANEWYLMGINDNFKKQNKKTYHQIIHEICGLEYANTVPVLEITENRRLRAAKTREKSGLDNYSEFILINLLF